MTAAFQDESTLRTDKAPGPGVFCIAYRAACVSVTSAQHNHQLRGEFMLSHRKLLSLVTLLALSAAIALAPVSAKTNGGRDQIRAEDLKEWLTYLASDEFEGRATYTEGLGLAAGYIAGQLKAWGVKPGGPNGSYFQRVVVLGITSSNHSTLTVQANDQTRTFKNKEGVTFPANVGGKRSFTAEEVEFVGYGLNLPAARHNDYQGKNVKGKVVVYLGSTPPKDVDPRQTIRAMSGRSRYATEQHGAVATIGPLFSFRGAPGEPGRGPNAAGLGQGQNATGNLGGLPEPDFTTVQRLETAIPPTSRHRTSFSSFCSAARIRSIVS
jgi:hypothetical protein